MLCMLCTHKPYKLSGSGRSRLKGPPISPFFLHSIIFLLKTTVPLGGSTLLWRSRHERESFSPLNTTTTENEEAGNSTEHRSFTAEVGGQAQ